MLRSILPSCLQGVIANFGDDAGPMIRRGARQPWRFRAQGHPRPDEGLSVNDRKEVVVTSTLVVQYSLMKNWCHYHINIFAFSELLDVIQQRGRWVNEAARRQLFP